MFVLVFHVHFNVLSLLSAHQAVLCKDLVQTDDPITWEEIPVITDLCLRGQRCLVQATGKVLGTMVLQEQAWRLNLADLSEEMDDMPIEADEALQICLP